LKFERNFLKEKSILIFFQGLLDYKNRNAQKKIFSLKKIKIFSVINVIENSIEKSKIIHKIEIEIYSLFLKFVGFDKILFLLIYFLNEIKKKLIFSLIIEQLRKKVLKFQENMKNKSSRYLLLKMVIKSSSKRIKLAKIALLENLISLKLVHINYLPRAFFEKKILNHFYFNSDFDTINFFYNRISEWQRTTRFDKKNLQTFLNISNKREQKIAIKTLVKVKKAKRLFKNGVLNFCLNFIESISFFISYRMQNIIKLGLLRDQFSSIETRLLEIRQLNLFYHLYLKRIKFVKIKS
jgi:hypothetical protein